MMNQNHTNIPDGPEQWEQYSRLLAQTPKIAPSTDVSATFKAGLAARSVKTPLRDRMLRWYGAPALALATMIAVVCLNLLFYGDAGDSRTSTPILPVDAGNGKVMKPNRRLPRQTTPEPISIPAPQVPSPPDHLHDNSRLDPLTPNAGAPLRPQDDPTPGPGYRPRR